MSFLRQYGIIIDQETGKLCSTCKAGERDLVVDAVLKEYFRTGVMPAADRQTYVMNPARLRRVGACRKLTFPDEPDKT